MRACTRVVYTITKSCTGLQNYTLVYTNMAARRNSALKMKNRLKALNVTTWHFFATDCKIKQYWMNKQWTSLTAAEVTSQASFAGLYSLYFKYCYRNWKKNIHYLLLAIVWPPHSCKRLQNYTICSSLVKTPGENQGRSRTSFIVYTPASS